ncbi:hypothetical protein NLC82_04315 [Candidatus Aminicenantes bacterium AC-335-A11]|jgi:hypothetical protein|nr:hypothetical protein [SCandidatus Aminicenantes bacterium Aminicenantia_JdfR_composite]MCP2606374.1 hypothetical protein [Candidatus Aminicenantes bacterium AC-708-I09]MCP2618626.1 hypothetical protein [Candidatus Aminicenantes bacterium AC-335-A11]MCP2620973.1 hypothetical protein [Candidatus Aminicenantes bacterium AC-334-E05]
MIIKKHLIYGYIIIFTTFFVLSCLPPLPEETKPKVLPEQIPIQKAWVDPAFSTTKIRIIALLPFSNAVQFDENISWTLYNKLLEKFREKHPEYSIISPQDVKAKIDSAGLSDDFNVFLGDYLNTGVANKSFLMKLKRILKVDVVLFGEITAAGSYKRKVWKEYFLRKGGYWDFVTENKLGIKLACYRGKDGRKIWLGQHTIIGNEKQVLTELADTLCTIFAVHFGRRSY